MEARTGDARAIPKDTGVQRSAGSTSSSSRYGRRPRMAKATRDGLATGSDGSVRCFWCAGDPLYESYHDREWGFPVSDDVRLFEKICLEGFQAGLSWITVLRKREAFRRAFAGFDPVKVARFDESRIERLMADPGIVRARAKIEATIAGARIYGAMAKQGESFAEFCWSFTDGKVVKNDGRSWV